MKKEKELLLLEDISVGNQAAFAQLVRQYTRIVYPYLLYWLKNAQMAEELTQDVFMRLWEKRDKLTHVKNFGGYLYITTRNIAMAVLEKRLVQEEATNPDTLNSLLSHTLPDSPQLLEMKELSKLLDQAIGALPPRRKEVFLLSRMEGMTYEAIAVKLQISRSAVRQHIVEALVFLRHYLKENAGIIVSLIPFFAQELL
ncbi:RNA polymerase sigma factor [Pseudobacter ginsenosidimutans]|uniref:RNA polymerase sigma-70 factor (ECF subfamily) n=1 Tax=Pseudobacter ginsenosidimutans TaxID=661488 RepID=A0A4Q7N0L2_9BACT|nr:RNA polymerase sigma-70 factor [Pseudobacter ginsenosidimutans]QEC43328.1 RNA polymerase sigma-70 factor [Pseudobacter ginsenosidimutans]RZS74692.1 RNA polymerase sigma-70 factor (ECF subfamily) [Pseudobacter ginsenosidimutans]